jgi:hypothetical protein
MRFSKVILALVLLVLVLGVLAFAEDQKVRVIASQANIRLKADLQSTVLSRVPLGGILDVLKKEGEWYFVKLPPDAQGVVVTGYIHQSTVEVMETPVEVKKVEVKPQPVKVAEEEKPVEPAKSVIKSADANLPASLRGKPLSEKEKHFLETDPYYFTWRDNLDKAQAEQRGAKKWIWIGGGAFLAGAIAFPLIGMGGEYSGPSGGGLMEQSTTTVGTICAIVAVTGAGVATYGLISYLGKGKKVGKITEEGIFKGYILGLNVNPEQKRYGITVTYVF